MAIIDADNQLFAGKANEFSSLNTEQLRVGSKLRIPIFDDRNILLLNQGQIITASFLKKLVSRGISQVRVHQSELARLSAGRPQGTATTAEARAPVPPTDEANSTTRKLDESLANSDQLGLPPQGEAFKDQIIEHKAEAYDEELYEQFIDNQEESVEQLAHVYESLSKGEGLVVNDLAKVADEALDEMVKDMDLFACLGMNPHGSDYPARHSNHTSMLAMSIGVQLKLDRKTLKELAIGCMIHDAGMLHINQSAYRHPNLIDESQYLEITKHPVLVFDLLKDLQGIPHRSAFIAYQIHERCDGSGYPRRREGSQIHFLSKIAAVADAYVGLASPRDHRPGMHPYYAIAQIIRDTSKGLFDPSAVRALLETVSLFPIGSYVELSDGRCAKVIRANGPKYQSPVVELYNSALQEEKELIDLVEQEELTIVKPVRKPVPNDAQKPSAEETADEEKPDLCAAAIEDSWE